MSWLAAICFGYLVWCLYLRGYLESGLSGYPPILTLSLLCLPTLRSASYGGPWSNTFLAYCVCIREEFVELASWFISVKWRFFLAFLLAPAFFSCAAITYFALINYSVLLMDLIMSLYLDCSIMWVAWAWGPESIFPLSLCGDSYYGRCCIWSFW